jgi:hypothetical protein
MTAPCDEDATRTGRGPSSESLQGRNAREVEVGRCGALWRFDRGRAGGQSPSVREDLVIADARSDDRG